MPQSAGHAATAADARAASPCWQDLRLPGPGLDISLATALAYLAFAIVLTRFLPGDDVWMALIWGVVPFTALPAIHAARRLSQPTELGALRAEFGVAGSGRRNIPLDRAAWTGLAGTFPVPLAVLGLVLPAYLCAALLAKSSAVRPDQHIRTAVILWAQVLASTCAAVALGAASAGRTPGPATVRAAFFSTLFLLLRFCMAPLIALAVLMQMPGRFYYTALQTIRLIAGVDAAFCVLSALPLGFLAAGLLRSRLLLPWKRPAPDTASPNLFAAKARATRERRPDPDELTGVGLEVSPRSLLRGKFWRDPLVRAERRHLWSASRLVLLWLSLPIVLTALHALGSRGIPPPFAGSPSVYWAWAVIVTGVLVWLPWTCLPALFMAALANGDRSSPISESMRITPITPLRLAAAKLVGRSGHLVLAMVVCGAAGQLLNSLRSSGWIPLGHGIGLVSLLQPAHALSSAARAFLLGTVGMYLGARQRTLVGAAAVAMSATLGLLLAESLAAIVLVSPRWNAHGAAAIRYVVQDLCWSLAQVLFYLTATVMLLAGAARHMAMDVHADR